MIKVAIVCDNYKLPSFRQKLNEAKLVVLDESPFVDNTTIMRIICNENQLTDIHNICVLLEINFKQSN